MTSQPSPRAALADLERAATAAGRAGLGAFRIDGLRPVERAARAGAALRLVVATRSVLDSADARWRDLWRGLAAQGVPVVAVADDDGERLTGGRGEGPVSALVDLPGDPGLAPLAGGGLALVGVDIDDPGNVGALVRTALASGCSLYVSAGHGDPFHPRAVRISRGAVVKQPIARRADAMAALDALRRAGVRTVGAVAAGAASPLDTATLTERPLAIVVGNEALGLDPRVAAALDATLTIPMGPGVDSFAVNAAAAIVLWEARRGG